MISEEKKHQFDFKIWKKMNVKCFFKIEIFRKESPKLLSMDKKIANNLKIPTAGLNASAQMAMSPASYREYFWGKFDEVVGGNAQTRDKKH